MIIVPTHTRHLYHFPDIHRTNYLYLGSSPQPYPIRKASYHTQGQDSTRGQIFHPPSDARDRIRVMDPDDGRHGVFCREIPKSRGTIIDLRLIKPLTWLATPSNSMNRVSSLPVKVMPVKFIYITHSREAFTMACILRARTRDCLSALRSDSPAYW